MAIGPRPLAPLLLFGLLPVASWFIIRPLLEPLPSIPALYSSFGLSIFAFLATIYLIPTLGPVFIKANLKGRDLLKVYKNEVEMYAENLFWSRVEADHFFSDRKVWASYVPLFMCCPSSSLFRSHSQLPFVRMSMESRLKKELQLWSFLITRFDLRLSIFHFFHES